MRIDSPLLLSRVYLHLLWRETLHYIYGGITMGIKNESALKRSWFVLTDEGCKFSEVAEDYAYPISRYDGIAIGPDDWNTEGFQGAAGFRISATRRELVELLKDYKETYPNANITVMRS